MSAFLKVPARAPGMFTSEQSAEWYECCGGWFDVMFGKFGCPHCQGKYEALLKTGLRRPF